MYDAEEGVLKNIPDGVAVENCLCTDVQTYVRDTATAIYDQDYVTDHNFIMNDRIGVRY